MRKRKMFVAAAEGNIIGVLLCARAPGLDEEVTHE
jgi:hypothetical protein